MMTTAMDSALATLPHPVLSAHVKSVAETILRSAQEGERDPLALTRMALLELDDLTAGLNCFSGSRGGFSSLFVRNERSKDCMGRFQGSSANHYRPTDFCGRLLQASSPASRDAYRLPRGGSHDADGNRINRRAERACRRGRDGTAHARRRYRGGCRISSGRSRQCRRGDRHSGIPLGHLPAVHRHSDARQHGRPEAGPRGARPLARHQDHPGFRSGEAIRRRKTDRQPLLWQTAGRRANDRRIAGDGGRGRAEDRSRRST